MKQRINVGIVQMDSLLGDVESNTAKAVAFIEKAAKEGAHFVCLPELFATGYNMNILGRGIIDLSERYYGYIHKEMSEAARRNRVHVIAPFASKRSGRGPMYNSVQVFDDEGREIGSYAKTHLWDLENLYFAEGTEYPVFDTKFGRIGILVCYDMEFPEACRELSLKGAEIVFAPAAWNIKYERDWDIQYRQRAVENRLFAVGVNRVGTEGDLTFLGKGKIHDPEGNKIIELPVGKESVAVGAVEIPVVIPVAGLLLETALPVASGGEDFLHSVEETVETNVPVKETDLV